MKINLQNDYGELAHPAVIEALAAIGTAGFEGYGLDEYSGRAAQLIKSRFNAPDAQVHFVCGGTQANLLAISSALRPHEAVIAAGSGHISVHEAGAVEATGHKICTAETTDGKLRACDIEKVVSEHTDEHMVQPRLVYISQSTETGMVYTKEELSKISSVCRRHNLYLFIDGARLGTALNSSSCDLAYADMAEYADVFYIGGTKNGAIFGEAIVIVNKTIMRDFRYHIKQKGALIAKGAALGIQFEALLKDELYDKLAVHANEMAGKLAAGIKKAGHRLAYPAQTNMVFPVLPADIVRKLQERFMFHEWFQKGDMITVRLVTSWATPGAAVEEFLSYL